MVFTLRCFRLTVFTVFTAAALVLAACGGATGPEATPSDSRGDAGRSDGGVSDDEPTASSDNGERTGDAGAGGPGTGDERTGDAGAGGPGTGDERTGDAGVGESHSGGEETGDRDTEAGPGTPSDAPGGLASCSLEVAQEGMALPLWKLGMADDQWEELHRNVYEDVEVTGEVCIDGVSYPVGVEVQGASSRSLPKKNYKLKFNRGPELKGEFFGTERTIDKVILKAMATDRAMIRETLAFELWREMGHQAPRESFYNLQINDRYHGVYVLVEPVDKDYLRRRGIPEWGRMYKGVRKHGSFADFRPGRPLDKAFEDKTTPESPNFTLLEEFVALVQDESLEGEGFADVVGSQISLEEYVDRMIWISFTQNGDALRQNFFLYHIELEGERPWRMIPWDSNLCFGADWQSPESLEPFDSGFHRGGNLFAERVLETPSLRQRFKQRYLELLETVFEEQHLQQLFLHFADQVRDDLHWDQARWEYPTDPETALGAVQEFLEVRPGLAREHLE